MRTTFVAIAVVLALPAVADTGAELGLRTGFSLPFGKIDGDATGSISDGFSGFIPLTADLGWRFTPNVYAGLTVSYSLGLTKNCPSTFNCSGHDVGLGFDLRYHVLPDQPTDPWMGIGAGYEWLTLSASQGTSSATVTAHGFEFVHVQAGVDLSPSPRLRWGPFVQFGLGQYRTTSGSASPGGNFSADIANKALHEFLTFGLRVSYLP